MMGNEEGENTNILGKEQRLQNKITSLETLSSGTNGRTLITVRGLVRPFALQLGDWLNVLLSS